MVFFALSRRGIQILDVVEMAITILSRSSEKLMVAEKHQTAQGIDEEANAREGISRGGQ